MKKISKRLIAMLLVIATLFALTIPAMATDNSREISPRASAYITAVWASCSGGSGSITVDFRITATKEMTSLGATTIEIKNSSGTTVKLFSSSSTENMMGSNQTYYSSSVTWSGASAGSRYYAIVYFKAANSSGYDTTSYTTSYTTAQST